MISVTVTTPLRDLLDQAIDQCKSMMSANVTTPLSHAIRSCDGRYESVPTQALSSPTTVPRLLGKLRTFVTRQAVSNQVPPQQVTPAVTTTTQKGAATRLQT